MGSWGSVETGVATTRLDFRQQINFQGIIEKSAVYLSWRFTHFFQSRFFQIISLHLFASLSHNTRVG